jgi:tetratricopeptide (TPR) repeat protein
MSRRQEDAALLADIAGDLGSLNELKPQAREFLLWYAQRPAELTTAQRVQMASQLARYFERPEAAASLMEGLADSREWDIFGVHTNIAVARLAKGYDAASARQIVTAILGMPNIAARQLHDPYPEKRDALERGGAHNELRELGAAYVREADATGYRPFKSEYYAAASDYYLRSGERERAVELARRALGYMPDLLRDWVGYVGVDRHDLAAMAIEMRGVGTDAVIALYRTGAIDEALKTHALTGKDRYLNSKRAGETKDPLWILANPWPEYFDLVATEAARSNDRDFQQRVYDGLVRSCGKSLADCSKQTLRNIALVAAGMGDRTRMKAALADVVLQIKAGKDASSWAVYIAGPWAHCEEVLRAATGPSSTPATSSAT